MSSPERLHDVVVLGGGMVGPVAAMALVKAGFGPVDLLERRPPPGPRPAQPGRSVHVILSARGWRMLGELGVEGRVRELCLPLDGRMLHLPGGEQRIQPYSRDGKQIWCVDRHQLNRVLLGAAEATDGVRMHYDAKVLEVDPERPALRTTSGWHHCARVIGCDGVHSVARAALVDRGARQRVERLGLGYVELSVDADWDPHYFQLWPRGGPMFTAFPSFGGGFTGSLFLPRTGDGDTFESLTTPAAAEELFQRLFPDVLPRLVDLPGELAGHPVNPLTVSHCDTWGWRDTAVLLGDSCHAMAPFMGQGMNCGFEDVRVFVDCLRELPGWGQAIERYATTRRPDADAITEISSRHYHNLANPPAASPRADARKRCIELLADELPEQFQPIYERCAFSEEPYSQILRRHEAAERLVDVLLDTHGVTVAELPAARLAELVRSTPAPTA